MQSDYISAPSQFDVFISYSRRDAEFAVKLEQQLEAYRPPRNSFAPRRYLQVFRDEHDFEVGDYERRLNQHLGDSRKLIVVCSPDARRSAFVNDEIRRFATLKGTEHIIPILVSGIPNNTANLGEEELQAFPQALCDLMNLPIAIDYRKYSVDAHRFNEGSLFGAWNTLLAGIYGVSRELIEQREKKRTARTKRQRVAAVIFLVILMLGALGWRFYIRTDRYQIQTIQSESQQILELADRNTLRTWLFTLVFAGQVDLAISQAHSINNPYLKSVSLSDIAFILAKVGKITEAQEVVNEAQQIAASLKLDSRESAFERVAVVYARLGRINEMHEALNNASRPLINKVPYEVYPEIAEALIEVGETEKAVLIADQAKYYGWTALLRMAKVLLHQGKMEQAKSAAFSASRLALEIENDESQVNAFAEVSVVLARAGEMSEAMRVVNIAIEKTGQIDDDSVRNHALEKIAIAQAKLGLLTAAMETVEKIDVDPRNRNFDRSNDRDQDNKKYAYSEIAMVLAQLRRGDDVVAILNRVEKDDTERSYLFLARITFALGIAGKATEVRRVAEKLVAAANHVGYEHFQSLTYARLSAAFAELKSFKRAREFAEKCRESGDRLNAYSNILLNYTKAKNPSLVGIIDTQFDNSKLVR